MVLCLSNVRVGEKSTRPHPALARALTRFDEPVPSAARSAPAETLIRVDLDRRLANIVAAVMRNAHYASDEEYLAAVIDADEGIGGKREGRA